MALGMFYPSISGMEAQSHAMESVSMNIANMRTVGYKSEETMFFTLLGSTPTVKSNSSGIYGSKVDIHGVGYYDRTHINKQGLIGSTGNVYDVAINRPNAFFAVKDEHNDTYYTRAGDFGVRNQNGETYLVNSQGMKVQGFSAIAGGGFSSSLQDITFKNQERVPSIPTTKADITANVPATGVDTSSYGINIVGPNNDGQNMNMTFNKVAGKLNTWNLSFTLADGVVQHLPTEVVFANNGEILTPKNFDIDVTWNDGSTNNVKIDISKMTQYAGESGIVDIDQDGRKSGDFIKSFVDSDGVLKGSYTNGQILDYAKIALVGFTAPENLSPISGTLFFAGNDVGNTYYVMNHDTVDRTMLEAQALEQSTVNVENEFSKMIMVQRAYSMNSQTFTANVEMLSTLINLKS